MATMVSFVIWVFTKLIFKNIYYLAKESTDFCQLPKESPAQKEVKNAALKQITKITHLMTQEDLCAIFQTLPTKLPWFPAAGKQKESKSLRIYFYHLVTG